LAVRRDFRLVLSEHSADCSAATVNGWERKTPAGFILAAKIPQIITHQNVLQDCDEDLNHFLETMELMGES